VSLETRIPFLDHRVVEFVTGLPFNMNYRYGRGKRLLRSILDRYVPRILIERPKMGFDIPVDTWLRGKLRDWAEDLLAPSRIQREGFFDPEPIQQEWVEHLDGTRDRGSYLWPVLMFQAWHEYWMRHQGRLA